MTGGGAVLRAPSKSKWNTTLTSRLSAMSVWRVLPAAAFHNRRLAAAPLHVSALGSTPWHAHTERAKKRSSHAYPRASPASLFPPPLCPMTALQHPFKGAVFSSLQPPAPARCTCCSGVTSTSSIPVTTGLWVGTPLASVVSCASHAQERVLTRCAVRARAPSSSVAL